MKIRWLDTIEADVTDQFDEKSDNIAKSHIEVFAEGTTNEVDIVNVHKDKIHVDIQFDDGSVAYHMDKDSFEEIPDIMPTKDYYGEGECPECHLDVPEDAKVGDKCSCGRHTFVNTFLKITIGYVVQDYKTLPNGTHVCTGQQFVAGDVTYESTEYADGLNNVNTKKEEYCPFVMTQPKDVPSGNPVKDSYENGDCPDCDKKIPDDVIEGDACFNCGHVFYAL